MTDKPKRPRRTTPDSAAQDTVKDPAGAAQDDVKDQTDVKGSTQDQTGNPIDPDTGEYRSV